MRYKQNNSKSQFKTNNKLNIYKINYRWVKIKYQNLKNLLILIFKAINI